jgi:hypothetical protein
MEHKRIWNRNASKSVFAFKNLRCLWSSVHLAQKMGQRLGYGKVLFQALSMPA